MAPADPADIDRRFRQHDNDFVAVYHMLQVLDGKADRVDARVGQVDTKVDRVDARVGQVDAKVDRVDARVGQLDAKVDQILTLLRAGGADGTTSS